MTVGSYGVAIVEKGVIAGEENGMFRIVAGGETSEATYLLVYRFRYGYSAYTGIVRYGLLDFKEALESKELPRSLVIIGGGVIGMEFASFFNSMGGEGERG